MTAVPTTREEQLSQLLGCTVAQLDISDDDFLAAEQRYLDLGEHLAEKGAEIYVQGSFMLGTVVAPYGRWGEYDLDLVCEANIAKQSTTQKKLKERVGVLLDEYIEEAEGDDVPKACTDGRRAWTLHYDRFHMDFLPSIPDAEAKSPTAIELTDKQLREWQKSDPLAYVDWFRLQCAQQFINERRALAVAAGGSIDDVPAWRVRMPLHRVVQVLKRHRDVHFRKDPNEKPPSSLITTLAGRAYAGEQDLFVATLEVVQSMPAFIDNRDGVYWVENPVCKGENFADKWREYPQRRVSFERWHKQVAADLEGLLYERGGVRAVHERMESAFGREPVREAVKVVGEHSRHLRETGELRVSAGGTLTTGAGRSVRDHRFYGGPAPA